MCHGPAPICTDGCAWCDAYPADRPSGELSREGGVVGGTIVDEEETAEYHWFHVKNRPLDQDNVPHRPADMEGPEAGHYWVMMPKQQIPREYRHWARMTVVGQVTGTQRSSTEPVLSLLYVRGWGTSQAHDSVWEKSSDPNYIPSVPAGLGGEFKGALP